MNGGRLQTNAAVFFTKYKNVQIPGSIPTYDADDNVNGFAGSLTNAAEFQNTPRHSGNLTASYDWPLVLNGRSGTVSLMNSVSYKSRVYQSEFVRTGANAALDATVPGNLLLGWRRMATRCGMPAWSGPVPTARCRSACTGVT